jgi:hypothetical protein
MKEIEFEKCVLCEEQTDVPKNLPIELREHYVEGAGQLCPKCYLDCYDTRDDKGAGKQKHDENVK